MPWRHQFGVFRGIRVALALRQAIWAAPQGEFVAIKVPGLPRPIEIRAGSSDVGVFFQVFGDHQADFPVSCDPLVIVDAGANIGLTAAVFASRFPKAKVIALEIDSRNYSLLRRNTGAYPNIEPLHKGLWSNRARICVANPDAESWAFTASEVMESNAASVEALGISDILADFGLPHIDVLKIDIEGGEYEVFSSGVHDWIDRVGMIAVETHDRFRPGCTESIRNALAPYGFTESVWSEYLIFRRKTEKSN